MRRARTVFTVFATSGALAMAAPANAQMVEMNPPVIESPDCAGDCSRHAAFMVIAPCYWAMIDAATCRLLACAIRAQKAERAERAARNFPLACERQPDRAQVRHHVDVSHYLRGYKSTAKRLLQTALDGSGRGELTDRQRELAREVLAEMGVS